MFQTIVKIDGMMCGMCEAHICDAIRRNFAGAKKVSASHGKETTIFLTETAPDEKRLEEVIKETGYLFISSESEKYVKKRGVLSWVLEFAGRKRVYFGGSVLLAVLGVAASFVPYLIIADIVEQLLSGNREWEYYLRQVFLMAFFWVVRMTLHSISTALSHVATFTVLGGIRKQLCEKLSRIPLGSVLDDNSGSYKNIIVERVDSMETTLAHIVPKFTANLLLPVTMFVYLLALDWRLGLANLVGALIGLCCAMVMFAKSKGGYELSIEKTKKLNDTAVEYINGIEVIKAFGKTGSSYEKFVVAAREGADVFIDWMRRCIWPQAGTMSFLPATFLGVLPVGMLLVKNGSLTTGNFITAIILSAGLITPLVVAFSYTDDLLKIGTIFVEVTEILERKDMVRPSELQEIPKGADIVLEDVKFTYKDTEVLHGINMEIRQGEVAAIVGPSGSGKSTIVRLIDSLWDVDSGTITYGGVDIKDLPLDYYMGQIAYVAQDNYLFDLSVKENIRLRRAGATDEDVIHAAKASGCHEFIMELENGYDTIVGGAGGHLSGGERQRICIARAMLKDAPVVILDEATAYTDSENEALVQSSVAKLVKSRTLIVIAHRLSTIVDADRIFVIHDGMVEASGTQEELLKSCGLYRKMWEAHRMAKDEDVEADIFSRKQNMFEMVKKFFDFCSRKNRKKFYQSAVLGVLEAVFTAMKIPAAFFAVKSVLDKQVDTKAVLAVIGLMLMSTLGKTVINRFSSMLQTEAGYDTCALKRIEIEEHLRYLPMGYFNDTSLGHITSVTTNTMEQTGDIATRAIMMVLQGSITTVVVALFMFAFDVRIGLIALCGIGVFLLVNQWTNLSVARVADEKLSADRDMVGVILEYIQGIAEIRNYNIIGQNQSRIQKAIERKKNADIQAELAAIPAVGVQNLITKLIGVVIAGASLKFCLDGTMEMVYTITMLLCSFMVFESLDLAGTYTALLKIIGKGVDLANEILSIEQMDIDGEEIRPADRDIHLEHVSFAYENRKIIDDVTLDIKENTTTAIVGPSGGGKTTITSLIARFWDVQEGQVTLGGRNVKDFSFDSLMENFSFVFQRVYLFEDTIANNIRFGRPEASMEEAVEAAKKAACHDFIMALSDGYETVIGEGGATLSGGEKQRIAIARAIMKDAPIIILDEATANVDPENEKELTEAIENLTKQKTIIMIAHRLKTVRNADQIIVVEKGKIVQKGKHEKLMEQEGIYRNFVTGRKQAVSWKLA